MKLEDIEIKVFGILDLVRQSISIHERTKDISFSNDRLKTGYKILQDMVIEGFRIGIDEFVPLLDEYCGLNGVGDKKKDILFTVFENLILSCYFERALNIFNGKMPNKEM